MMKLIRPSAIEGRIKAPASKSEMQRVIAAALLTEGNTYLQNVSYCEDSLSALAIVRLLGATIQKKENTIVISGGMKPITNELDCGESGLCLRMFTPICALFSQELLLVGKGSLRRRPLPMLEKPMQDLGAECKTKNGYMPVRVKGPLQGGKTKVDGSLSSQFLTGLLMALPVAPEDSELQVLNLRSKAYVEMTIDVLKRFEVRIDQREDYFIIPGKQRYQACDYTIEGDWSGAAFMIVAGALGGLVIIDGLKIDSLQPDRAIMDVLMKVGAKIDIAGNCLTIRKDRLKAFEFDATNCPDLFPPLVALASNCTGISSIKGVNRLRYKESDRASALQQEFGSLGIAIDVKDDQMLVHGGIITGGRVFSHNDHRIAMSTAVAGLTAKNSVTIEGAECVAKSYPTFFDDLKSIGGQIDE